MGASESTAKPNGTMEEEEERQQLPAAAGAFIAAGVVAVGMAASAWGISRLLSDSTDDQHKQNAMKFSSSNSRGMHESYRTSIIPSVGFTMKTDGACRPYQGSTVGYVRDDSVKRGPSGYGGILLDDRKKWVRGFQGFIGVTDCLTAEFHGIFNGLQLLDKLGMVDSILESDCKAAIGWINHESYRHVHSKIIEDCWEMIKECKRLKNKNRITIRYCSRDDNKCADKLASMAIDKRVSYVDIIYKSP